MKDATSDDCRQKTWRRRRHPRATTPYNAVGDGAADPGRLTMGHAIAFADGNLPIRVNPGIHTRWASTNSEALDADGHPRLQVTGGIHGNNRIGGNAVCDITTFGRNVGERIADSLQ